MTSIIVCQKKIKKKISKKKNCTSQLIFRSFYFMFYILFLLFLLDASFVCVFFLIFCILSVWCHFFGMVHGCLCDSHDKIRAVMYDTHTHTHTHTHTQTKRKTWVKKNTYTQTDMFNDVKNVSVTIDTKKKT